MGDGVVSVLIPRTDDARDAPERAIIERYLESAGFDSEVIVAPGVRSEGYGAVLRRVVAGSHGDTVIVVDEGLPYPVDAIGDAIAMIRSGHSDVVFATTRQADRDDARYALLRTFLVPILPDPELRLRAFSGEAARLVIGESKLAGDGCELEIAYLANKYGFRVDRLHVTRSSERVTRAFGPLTGLLSVMSIRLHDRRMAYRASRRCPICFSAEVWSMAQIPENIVRACRRCKCRYLNQFSSDGESRPVHRVLRPAPPLQDPMDETQSARSARDRTGVRRLNALRKHLPPRARLLHIGAGDGGFGAIAAREFEYVGIEAAPAAARAGRAKGLEIYCATVSNFVNTGPAFDAVALFHVLEDVPDPHDALCRIKELLKPGGVVFLTAFDTEGVLYLLTEPRRMAQNFRTHMILYSRSALIELLERSGFEIETIGPEFEYRDRRFLRHVIASRWPRLAAIAASVLNLLPNPLLVSSSSIRIIAKRRSGPPHLLRPVHSVEATHAR